MHIKKHENIYYQLLQGTKFFSENKKLIQLLKKLYDLKKKHFKCLFLPLHFFL
jgi:hypothetical protein